MRFCPFCAQENTDGATECAHCGRRLPAVVAPTVKPAAPVVLPPRPAPVRPMPRPRAVTPAPTLPAPPKPSAPPPSAPLRPSPAPAAEPEGATRVESSPFEAGETTVSPRFGHGELEQDSTAPTERAEAEAPTAMAMPAPAAEDPIRQRRPTPAGLKASTTPPWGAEAMAAPPAPPPPATAPVLPDEPFELPKPIADAPVAAPPEPRADPASLPPMPEVPPPGVLPAVKYLLPVAQGIWARHRAQSQLRALLHDDQRLVDEALHDLGQAAWRLAPRPAELRGELDRADEDDARRRTADQEMARLDMSVAEERERFAEEEQRRKSDIASREAEIARLDDEQAERKRAQRVEEKALRELEGRFRAADKQVKSLIGKAAKAEQTPPEKGGGTAAATALRQEAEAVQREAEGLRPQYEAQGEKVRAFDAPIAELGQRLTDERAALVTAKAELDAARRSSQDKLSSLGAERATQEEARGAAERGVRLRLVSTGTLLSLHRLDGPEHTATFAPIYQRLDELQAVAAGRDARIGTLETERRSYDRPTVRRGLAVVGGVVALLLILLIVLIAR